MNGKAVLKEIVLGGILYSDINPPDSKRVIKEIIMGGIWSYSDINPPDDKRVLKDIIFFGGGGMKTGSR